MKIKPRDLFPFVFLAIVSFCIWYRLEYPRFAFFKLPFNKQQAIGKSIDYLRGKYVDTGKYAKSAIFDSDERANRYLQHTVGIKGEEEFIRRHDFDLFRWSVRFFKEYEKEEYRVHISPGSGRVVKFAHLIDDTEPRIDLGKEASKHKAESFLRGYFGADLEEYDFHEEKVKRYENRVEYVFSWEKNDVYIPWNKGKGGAKLLAEVTVSGEEIREFCRNKLDFPDGFIRYVEKQFILGEYLYSIFYVILFGMLIWAVNIFLKRKQDVVPRLSREWFYWLAFFLVAINTADFFNNCQRVLAAYPTSAHLGSFFGLAFIRWVFNTAFLVFGFVIPGISGESLFAEVFPENKQGSFLYYIRTSFFNRAFTVSILSGYLFWLIMLGIQAAVFYCGQRFMGVWREWYVMTYFSSAYIPVFSAFVIAFTASLNEEVIFRLFGVSLAKKYLRSSLAAVVLTAVIWGMGHTTYAIFPVWFRIIEITLLGIFYGFIFMRFGLIPLLVAHYLFDVFWCSAAYLLGDSQGQLFYASVGLLCLPLVLSAGAYFVNGPEREKPFNSSLDKEQEYNLNVLLIFISAKRGAGYSREQIGQELILHGWDRALVELALGKAFTG